MVGPYQGSHGCLRIAPGTGVCGAAAASKATQLVRDVHAFPGHIACSSSSNSEVPPTPPSQSDVRLSALLSVQCAGASSST